MLSRSTPCAELFIVHTSKIWLILLYLKGPEIECKYNQLPHTQNSMIVTIDKLEMKDEKYKCKPNKVTSRFDLNRTIIARRVRTARES